MQPSDTNNSISGLIRDSQTSEVLATEDDDDEEDSDADDGYSLTQQFPYPPLPELKTPPATHY